MSLVCVSNITVCNLWVYLTYLFVTCVCIVYQEIGQNMKTQKTGNTGDIYNIIFTSEGKFLEQTMFYHSLIHNNRIWWGSVSADKK